MRSGPFRPVNRPGVTIEIAPETAGWKYLSFSLIEIDATYVHNARSEASETAIVTVAGSGTISVNGHEINVSRDSVFTSIERIVYVGPGDEFSIRSDGNLTVAIGSAPAATGAGTRVIETAEMRSEIRGGGSSFRQVVHSMSHPIEAERLIVYEVYIPRGTWAGWPPHRHDGVDSAPYLEETYYFKLDRPEGYVLHRNFNDGAAPEGEDADFDEVVVARDGDLALVPMGYHTSVTSPGSNMYFLNFLAGDLLFDDRKTPPCFHSDHTWIEQDWSAGAWSLPVVSLNS